MRTAEDRIRLGYKRLLAILAFKSLFSVRTLPEFDDVLYTSAMRAEESVGKSFFSKRKRSVRFCIMGRHEHRDDFLSFVFR